MEDKPTVCSIKLLHLEGKKISWEVNFTNESITEIEKNGMLLKAISGIDIGIIKPMSIEERFDRKLTVGLEIKSDGSVVYDNGLISGFEAIGFLNIILNNRLFQLKSKPPTSSNPDMPTKPRLFIPESGRSSFGG